MKKPLISCENMTLGYENNAVLADVCFDVYAGDYLCVVGENGAGKSTLIKCLAGLKKPMRGSLTLAEGLSRRDIGYLPQQTAVQRDFPASVREVVLSGCLNNGRLLPFYTKADKSRAAQYMDELGVGELAEQAYRDLSGGQRQRVLLARALCASGRLLILDEPVTGLVPIVTGEIYALIRMLNDKYGITVIMVSHDVGNAVKSANKILHIKNAVQFFGSTADYLKSPVGQAFVGGGCSYA